MPRSPLHKLVRPRFPSTAVGIESNAASIVQLDRARGGFVVKRAASIDFPAGLIQPSFDQPNLTDPKEVARALSDLASGAGLLRQRKFSASLPEAATRSAILTLEGAAGSRRESQEVFEWKIERSFGAPLSELRISREQMSPDAQGQTRYLVNAIRVEVLAEFESVFRALGWHVGLILPRHTGEEQWLRNGKRADGLLLTAHEQGFTTVLMRGEKPLAVRSVLCEPSETDDELHRILLFYRDRAGTPDKSTAVERLLVVGEHLDKNRVAGIAQETLGMDLRPLNAGDVGLLVPSADLDFDAIAAPAGLARMAW
jgi:hypothetical protein